LELCAQPRRERGEMLTPPGPAPVPSRHVVPSAPTPTSVAVTPIAEYDIAGPAAGAAAGGAGEIAGVGAAIAGAGGGGEATAVPLGAGAVGVGEGCEADRVARFAWPGGTCAPGVTGGGGGRNRAGGGSAVSAAPA